MFVVIYPKFITNTKPRYPETNLYVLALLHRSLHLLLQLSSLFHNLALARPTMVRAPSCSSLLTSHHLFPVTKAALPKGGSGFRYYSSDMHEIVKKQNPGLKFYQIYSILCENWRSIIFTYLSLSASFLILPL